MRSIFLSLVAASVLILSIIFFASGKTNNQNVPVNNVTIQNGVQIVEITAKGGYTPRKSSAKAGLQTILRVDTNGTFDCSSSIRIPSKNISKLLPSSGVTDLDLGITNAGILAGTCGMGMYPFEIDFQS